MLQGGVTVSGEEIEQATGVAGVNRQGREWSEGDVEGSAEVAQVLGTAGVGTLGRTARALIIEWAVDDEGLREVDVGEVQAVRRVTIRRGESKIHVESKARFDSRRVSSRNARQRCYVAVHVPEGNQCGGSVGSEVDVAETDSTTVWCGCIKQLAGVELMKFNSQMGSSSSGELHGGRCWKTVAVVEWKSSAKFDSIASLPFSTRKQGRVWKGKGVSAISGDLVDRVIGCYDMEFESNAHRHYVDTDYETLKLGDSQSLCQLHHL